MNDGAVREIANLANKNQTIDINGETYSNDRFYKVNKIPLITPLIFNTITSLKEFILDNGIKKEDEFLLYINDSYEIQLLTNILLEKENSRDCYVRVKNCKDVFEFNKWIDIENLIIHLQTKFVKTDTVKKLLSILSSIYITDKVSIKDDGISQKVESKQGISSASLTEQDIPSIVDLIPYRIFQECEQVESKFLFRIKNIDGTPAAKLIDVDSSSWKKKAFQNIEKTIKDLGIELPVYY